MQDIKRLISEHEMDMMYRYARDYLEDTRHMPSYEEWTNTVFNPWQRAKSEWLADIFQDSLILEKEVEFIKSTDEIVNELTANGNYLRENCPFYETYMKWVDEHRKEIYEANPSWADFGYYYRHEPYELMNFANLLQNKYQGETFLFPIENGRTVKIQHGIKPLKALGKIAAGLHMEGFEQFRVTLAQITNQRETHGTLCLSIHPFDYMTMSDNDSNWRSCMSWNDYGEYRQGTVEMMNSNCIVVAYLKSDKDMCLDKYRNQYWNNKKWRTLIIASDECICSVKGYPYASDELNTAAVNWLKELAEAHRGVEYPAFSVGNSEDLQYPGELESESDFPSLSFSLSGHMYNDMTSDIRTNHSIWYGSSILGQETIDINYGGESECMCCGKVYPYGMNEDSLLCCDNCYERIRCACCGDAVNVDDCYEIDGEYVCHYCVEEGNYIYLDNIYNESHFEDNLTRIYLKAPDNVLEEYRSQLLEVGYALDDKNSVFTLKRAHIIVYPDDFSRNTQASQYFAKEKYWDVDFINRGYITLDELSEEGKKMMIYNDYECKAMFETDCMDAVLMDYGHYPRLHRIWVSDKTTEPLDCPCF